MEYSERSSSNNRAPNLNPKFDSILLAYAEGKAIYQGSPQKL